MTIKVETQPKTTHEDDKMEIHVTTIDAIGQERVYRISLGKEMVDGEYVMASRQIKPEPDSEYAIGASERAYEAARKRFEAAKYEVF